MARKIHKNLSYEKKELAHAKYHLGILSGICYDIEKQFGKNFLDEQVWTYGMGITFKDTNQEQYKTIKSILPRLGKMDKESSKRGIVISGTCAEKQVAGQLTNLAVNFKWDVPDTCEIVTNVIKREASPEEYHIDDDGTIYHITHETKVNCTEPVLESVFANMKNGDMNG